MKRILAILMFALFLFAASAVFAQDVTAEPTAAATTEATQEATGGVVINNNTTSTPASSDNSTVVIILALMNVGQMGIILAQAIMNNGSVSKKTVDTFFTGLKGLAKLSAWEGDDQLVAGGEKVTLALLGDRIVAETAPAAGGVSPQG